MANDPGRERLLRNIAAQIGEELHYSRENVVQDQEFGSLVAETQRAAYAAAIAAIEAELGGLTPPQRVGARLARDAVRRLAGLPVEQDAIH